jgi:hypothetical protein
MKRHRKHILASVILMAVLSVGYVGYCIASLAGEPPLEFADDVEMPARDSIAGWYHKSDSFRHPLDFESLTFAVFHPRSPFLYRPLVSNGGLGGEGSIMLSFMGQVAVFNEVRGKWEVGSKDTAQASE